MNEHAHNLIQTILDGDRDDIRLVDRTRGKLKIREGITDEGLIQLILSEPSLYDYKDPEPPSIRERVEEIISNHVMPTLTVEAIMEIIEEVKS